MVAIQISEELVGTIQREAKIRGLSVEDYLRTAIQRTHTISARQKIEQEQEWWFSLPLSKRAKYEGLFIAVHNQKLVDHDREEEALYRRVRKKYGKTPILVMPAEGPREIHIYSPRIIRS